MIIVIAPENDVPNEIETLNTLFQEGLNFYHLRKPNKNYREHCDYIDCIDKQYHNRIVVHYCHTLINKYNLKGIHFREQNRKDHLETPSDYFVQLHSMFGKTISSSFHEIEDLKNADFEFDYHFLSPVFSSISKKGYEGRGFNVKAIDKTIIGMGGVTENNLTEFDKLGYTGVGTLGAIWESTNPLESFKKMQQHFTEKQNNI